MSNKKPARCPFCALLGAHIFQMNGAYQVICSNKRCRASGPIRESRADAIAAWDLVRTRPFRIQASVC